MHFFLSFFIRNDDSKCILKNKRKNLNGILNWAFYVILISDDSTLVDQCVVLHAYKKFVMLTFGEPKELSYYVMLDKGFLEKKKLSKYEEYDSKLDANIKKEIEILHKQNLEKEQIKIEE